MIEAATVAGALALAQRIYAAVEQLNQGKATDADLALIQAANDAKLGGILSKFDEMDRRDAAREIGQGGAEQ